MIGSVSPQVLVSLHNHRGSSEESDPVIAHSLVVYVESRVVSNVCSGAWLCMKESLNNSFISYSAVVFPPCFFGCVYKCSFLSE